MKIFLSLGSNVGNRADNIERALDLLAQSGVSHLQSAPIITSTALLPNNAQADWNKEFLNTVASGETALAPLELLATIKNIEQKIGRQPRGHWGPREIDVDILDYARQIFTSEQLTIPHQQLHLRDFVLQPLSKLAPDWKHPLLNKTAQELIDLL